MPFEKCSSSWWRKWHERGPGEVPKAVFGANESRTYSGHQAIENQPSTTSNAATRGFQKPHGVAVELVYRAENRCISSGALAGAFPRPPRGRVWPGSGPKSAISNPTPHLPTPGFLIHEFWAGRKSSISGVWEAPGALETIQKYGGLRPPYF